MQAARAVRTLARPALLRAPLLARTGASGAAGVSASAGSVAAGSRAVSGSTSFAGSAYHVLFKQNSTYLAYVLVGAIILEGVYGSVLDTAWNSMNYGVCFAASAALRGGEARAVEGAACADAPSLSRKRAAVRHHRLPRTHPCLPLFLSAAVIRDD